MSSLLRVFPFLLIGVLLIASLAGGVTFVLRQLNLYPPQQLLIAAGKPGSAYYDSAIAYRDILARDDIALEIVESNGSMENAALLAAEGGVDIALVQGGIPLGEDVRGIAAVRVEPLWVFASAPISRDPNAWEGLRVATGAEGSGTHVIAQQLSRITGASELVGASARAMGGAASAAALLAGEIDLALYVAPMQASYLQPLLAAEQLRLLSLAHSESIALRIPGARLIRLPSGVLDYQRPLPAEDLEMIALVTRLVSRDDLHPALVNRLVHAVLQVHGGNRVIPADRGYPSALDLGVEADEYAAQLFAKGFSALESILPYWIVAQLNRVLLVLVPAILLLLPLMRLLPSLYETMLKRRVYSHYARVHDIDEKLLHGGLSSDQLLAYRRELDGIEKKLLSINLPNSYRKQAYTLLQHLGLVRTRLNDAIATGSPVPRDTGTT
jgi:TRAP-type uncharacterized transport system substrate-binding protein